MARRLALVASLLVVVIAGYLVLGSRPLPIARLASGAPPTGSEPAAAEPTATGAVPSDSTASVSQTTSRTALAPEAPALAPTLESPAEPEPPARPPDMVVDLTIDPGLEERELELLTHFGPTTRRVDAILRRSDARLECWFPKPPRMGRAFEVRTVPPGGSTGSFSIRGASATPFGLRLRAVRHFELVLVPQPSEVLAGRWGLPDTYSWLANEARSTYIDAFGQQGVAIWRPKLEPSDDGQSATLTPSIEPLDFTVNLEGFEGQTYRLLGAPGESTRIEFELRRQATAGTLSGVVRTANGRNPDPSQLTGRLRIVDARDRNRQFNVELDWQDGVAAWESAPLPHGEYRVWMDDTGMVHTTPGEERLLTPPQRNLEWVWENGAERRDLALRVFAAESGERLESYSVRVELTPSRSYHRGGAQDLLVRAIPADSPARLVVDADGRAPQELSLADFRLPGWVDGRGNETTADGRPVWFGEVWLELE